MSCCAWDGITPCRMSKGEGIARLERNFGEEGVEGIEIQKS